ncbi:MAG: YdcF family protein [Puniceicoccales bacterium]|nr:YdcF family protein [Puniceicoccales bacterium]
MPAPMVLLLALSGALLLRFAVKTGRFARIVRTFGRVCLAFCFLALFFFSNTGVNTLMMLRRERAYAAQPDFAAGVVPASSRLARCGYVLVLGGGSEASEKRSALQRLPGVAQSRLFEGVRIARALPASCLVVSGGGMPGFPSAARESEDAAVSLGFPRGRILRFDRTLDTRDEIKAVKSLAGGAPVALVTSAFHLPRAMKLCAELGVDAVPCPAGYIVSSGVLSAWDFLTWNPANLYSSSIWFHEFLGSLFA